MCSNIKNNINMLIIVKYSIYNELKHCPVYTNRGRDGGQN